MIVIYGGTNLVNLNYDLS